METKTSVYDVPTRLFHWFFVVLLISAGLITQVVDDDSGTFGFHMILGMTLSFMIFLRLAWGLVGTQFAKFNSYPLHPRKLFDYFLSVFDPKAKRWIGHNPASAWSAMIMMALALSLGMTGYAMVSGSDKFFWEDIHENLAYALLGVAFLHVGGVMLHAFIHKDGILTCMITGSKKKVDAIANPILPHRLLGVIGIGIIMSFFVYMYSQYDVNSGILNIFGQELILVEDAQNSEVDDD